ncbi:uncharacterized protein FSUBG_12401 [Fusarium subglutinans]|uniref:Uncharacterized protein n=1 Tax=Gibberella subglutinans TaxID=42677 RepID=A0A8H5L7K2_GIBSU|nr:uncharacterized protein FSUBG_12401 [Fusarium subglutinans]KAF5585626.1 hypothetical protein FSUBG_12401 [Fusarium subglutinans]
MAHIPSKATILVCSGDHASEDPPYLDAKVALVNRPQPLRRPFARNFIWQELLKMTDWFLNEEKDVIDLRVNGVTKELVAKGCTGRLENVVMFDEQESEGDKITSQPSYIFSALKPDFSVIERMGFYVLNW